MNPINKKLKLKPNQHVLLLNAPKDALLLIEPLPENCTVSESVRGKYDTVLLFVENRTELEFHYKEALNATKDGSLLWFCYPKGSSKIQTDLTRDAGWESIRALNYQWVSLISLNDTWSAFAIRVGKVAPPPTIGAAEPNLVDKDGTVLINYETRAITMPASLKALLKKDKEAIIYFESLAFTHKKEYLIYIYEAKKEETRLARLEKAVQLLMERKKTPTSNS